VTTNLFVDAYVRQDGSVQVATWADIDVMEEPTERRVMSQAAFRAEFPALASEVLP
jgi:hypothetical protein